jgi:Ca2+-binding RTX toxin-like protein
MAKFIIGTALGDYGYLPGMFDVASLSMTSKSATSMVLEDGWGNTIKYVGTGFKIDKDGDASAGTVTTVEYRNADGDVLLKITGGAYALSKIYHPILTGEFNLFQAGNDTLIGTENSDTILVGLNAGDDKIFGYGGDDYISASSGNNRYDGGDGKDTLNFDWAYQDRKNVVGGAIVDVAKATVTNPWGGKDTFSSIEVYYGSFENDIFKGGDGKEEFDAVEGNDRITGGKGGDLFIFHGGMDKDTVTDFGNGADRLQITGFLIEGMNYVDTLAEFKAHATAKNGNLVVDFGNGDVLTLLHTAKSDLTDADFSFL